MNKISIRNSAPQSEIEENDNQTGAYLDENELREIFRKLVRRRNLIFITMALCSALTFIVLMETPPRYSGTLSLMVDPKSPRITNMQDVLEGVSKDTEAIFSEIEVLTSRQLIGRLVDKLDMTKSPEFNASLRPPTLLSKLDPRNFLPESWSQAVSEPKVELTTEEKLQQTRNAAVTAVLARLKVTNKTRTRVLLIDFQSESRETAMQVANTLADLYLVSQLDSKFEATQRVTNWLNDRLIELRKKVDESQRAVEAYRASAGLIVSVRGSGAGATLVDQQIAELSTQMTAARTDRIAAESKLKQIKAIAGDSHGAETVTEVLDSPIILHLREQEAEIERQIADYSQQYGERHPKLITARAQLDDTRSKINSEVRKVMLALENTANVARARETAIAGQLEEVKRQVITSNAASVRLHELEMEAASNRTLMETFLSRFKETSAQESGNLQMPDARIISRATVPSIPTFPNVNLIMLIGLFVSGVLGVILAFIMEHLDRGFRSGVQFEHATGTPVLALIPVVNESKGRAVDYLVERPLSAYAESMRSIYTSLLLTQGNERMRTIVVSSCQPSEGKTTLAISLTRMIASSGQRVILIEADLRRPSLHHQLGIERGIGLAEVLIGSASLDEAIYSDPKTPAVMLLAGKETLNPSKLLASHQMDDLITTLKGTYDIVIIDTAPVLAVSDGLLLANRADGTIYCCRWATTSRETAALGLKELRDANARVVGAAITLVNIQKSRTYGYADTSYYHYAKKYYADRE